MNAVLKSFLLVSAAYLLGGPDAALADPTDREPAAQEPEEQVLEEGQPAARSSQTLLPNGCLPTKAESVQA